MRVFSELDRPVSMSSEWEGHAYLDAAEQDAFDMVAAPPRHVQAFLGKENLATV